MDQNTLLHMRTKKLYTLKITKTQPLNDGWKKLKMKTWSKHVVHFLNLPEGSYCRSRSNSL